MKQRPLLWVFIIGICIPLMLPFLIRGYFPTHDGEWAVVRLAEMHRELKDVQIPPRWAGYLNHGYGYPLFLFTYPFPYYLAEILHVFRFGLVDSVKLVFIISILGSALAMYGFGKKLWGINGALLSTIVYIYAPYRIANLYVRGSLGESLATVFFPLLFLQMWQIIETPKRIPIIISGVTLAAFILTHNAMAILFLPFLLGWTGWLLVRFTKTIQHIKAVASVYILGLALSATFWLPALMEKKYIALSAIPLADKLEHFMTLSELWSNHWTFGIRPPLSLGMIHLLIFGLSILGLFWVPKVKKQLRWGFIGFFLVAIVVSIFMLLPLSLPLWRLPLFKEIDFPWRTLGVVGFLLAAVAGSIAKMRKGTILVISLGILVMIYNLQFIKTEPRIYKSDAYYQTNDATTTSADELQPRWVRHKGANRPEEKIILSPVGGEVLGIIERSNWLSAQIKTSVPTQMQINSIFFPGWKVYINNNIVPVTVGEESGLMSVKIPAGTSVLKAVFTSTPVRILADLISIIAILGCLSLWLISKRDLRSS
jgi:hypothetical protein